MTQITGKKVEAETYLPNSSFNGTEITRIKKQVNGVWKNFFTKFSDIKTWITTSLGNFVQSVTAGNAIYITGTAQNPIINALTPPVEDGILNQGGGRVTWLQNYDYEGSASVYAIEGVIYTAPVTLMTLSPADPLLDRIDDFVLNTLGAWQVVEGTASIPPVLEPDIDTTLQLKCAFAYVTANTTQPTPSLPTENIYLENTEWVTAVSGAGLNVASPTNPYPPSTVSIEGTNVSNGQFITFTPPLFPSLILEDSFIFKIDPKAAWNAPSRLVWRFYNGTTPIGNAVNFGNNTYGFVSSNLVYQNINIPLSDFGNIAAATSLRMTKTGAGTIGFYLDNIQMVGNNNVVPLPQVNANWAAGTGVSAVLNKEITITVAQAQALVAASQLIPTMWYIISNAVSSFGVLRIRARDASHLERYGSLLKGGISYPVEYSLNDGAGNDAFTYFRDDQNNNTVWNYFDNPSFIPSIPLSGIWSASTFYISVAPTISDASKVIIGGSVFETGSSINLNHNGSSDAQPIQITNSHFEQLCVITVTAKSTGGTSSVSNVDMRAGASLNVTGVATCQNCDIFNSTVIIDDNNSDGTTLLSGTIGNAVTLIVKGISGGIGTQVNTCDISNIQGSITIQGGETYQNKTLSDIVSTFNGNRTITADGAYSFIDSSLIANYNRSFLGQWAITAAAPHNVTSFTDRDTAFSHEVTFTLASGSSTITFVDDGANIIMKGSANAVLAGESDFVTFRFVGQVAYEINRGIY